MTIEAVYTHVNLIARDWRTLAAFYRRVFGCVDVPPERNLRGPELEAGTGVHGATLCGVHLRLPGHGDHGPALEIFTYGHNEPRPATMANREGPGHLAFAVRDVEQARREVLDNGGSAVGSVVTTSAGNGINIKWCYVTDPEGNIIELQSWT